MLCEHYKDTLIDAAASGSVPLGELGAHLAECASCRAVLSQEQSLFDAIDYRLQAEANSEVPTSLLPRIRVRLDESTAPRFHGIHPLVFASAGMALALVLFLLVRPHHAAPEVAAKQGPAVVQTPVAAAKTNPERTPSQGTQVAIVGLGRSRASRNSTNSHSVASSHPEVLVPPGTEAAFLKNLPSLLKGFKPSEQWHEQGKELEIKPLDIEEISSAPLSPDEKDSDPNGGVGQLRSLPIPAEFLRAQRYKVVPAKVSS